MNAIRPAAGLGAAVVGFLLMAPGCGLQLSGLDTSLVDAGGALDATGHHPPTMDASQSGSSSGAPGDDGSSNGGDGATDDGATDATDAIVAMDDGPGADDGASGDGEVPGDAAPDAGATTGDDGGSDDASEPGADADAGTPLDATVVNDGAASDGASAAESGGGGPCGAPGSTCITVPSGWTLVALASSQTVDCPAGFGSPSNVVESPNASSACSCGPCSTTSPPTCGAGEIGVAYDETFSVDVGSCDEAATPPMLSNYPAGSCGTDLYTGGSYESFDIKYTAPGASGGVCSAPGVTGSLTFGAHDRVCAPTSPAAANCVGDTCAPVLAAPYTACLASTSPGSVACPAGTFDVAHVVGTGASFSCSACPCAVSATCSAGTVTLYTDATCSRGATSFTTGDCTNVALSTTNASFLGYKFHGGTASNVSCSATPGTAEDVTLTAETTVCCAQ
jgi:hypothetical protein